MKEIIVYADWRGLTGAQQMGILRAERIRGAEVFSFEYNSDWLDRGIGINLDPQLNLYSGRQYLKGEISNFGIFLDSSPDRWGRMLMERREAILAREKNTKKRKLFESDFLLGVNDETRMGAIRFKTNFDGPFLASEPDYDVPPFTSIRELEQASLNVEEDDFFEDKKAKHWLMLLMAPGSSLGGARPKASVKDPSGQLWIAKFPSKSDDKNSGAWEYLVNQIAKELGINVAHSSAKKYSQKQHTYLTKRFDRTKKGERIHFASAMTLLGYKDGDNYKDGISYLELVDLIEKFGAKPNQDIPELWRRIVFSVLVGNSDDHLRNHGFLLTDKGWILSPAYDINPNPQAFGLSLNINEDDNSLNLDLCLQAAAYYRLSNTEANKFIKLAKKRISKWSDKASELGIQNAEKVMMESAFDLGD